MGNFFGKSKRKEEKRSGSAPARLEGLDADPAPASVDNRAPPVGRTRQRISEQPRPSSLDEANGTRRQLRFEEPLDLNKEDTSSRPNQQQRSQEVSSSAPTQVPPLQLQQVHRKASAVSAADWPNLDIALVQKLFGGAIMSGVASTTWNEREQSLKAIRNKIKSPDHEDRTAKDHQDFWSTAVGVLQQTLRDKVAPVYFASLEVLRHAITICAKQIPQKVLHDGLDLVVPAIIHRSSNLNARISAASISILCFLAGDSNVGSKYIVPYVLEPVKSSSKNKNQAIIARLDLMLRLLEQCGLNELTTGLTVPKVLGLVLPALETPDDKVRNAAVTVILDVYIRNGRSIHEKYLVSLKPALRKMLQRKMMEVDSANCPWADGASNSSLPPLQSRLPTLDAAGENNENKLGRAPNNLTKMSTAVPLGEHVDNHNDTRGVRFANEEMTKPEVYTGSGPLGPAPARLKTPAGLNGGGASKYDYTGRIKTPHVRSSNQQMLPQAPRKGKPPKPNNSSRKGPEVLVIGRVEEDLMESILHADAVN